MADSMWASDVAVSGVEGWRKRFPAIDGSPDLSKVVNFALASGGYVVHAQQRWSPERAMVATPRAWSFATGSRFSSLMPAPVLWRWVTSWPVSFGTARP